MKSFQKVVFDFTGPISPTAARDGLRHVVCYTCRKTNVSRLYFCEKRSEFLFKFKEFINWTKQCGYKLDEVKCDQAREFMDKQVEELCESEKIVHHFSAPYAHENNAFAE